jgi:WD40 repeat protein
MKTGVVKRTLTGHSQDVVSIAFSPDGKMLASASWDGEVKLWDVSK